MFGAHCKTVCLNVLFRFKKKKVPESNFSKLCYSEPYVLERSGKSVFLYYPPAGYHLYQSQHQFSGDGFMANLFMTYPFHLFFFSYTLLTFQWCAGNPTYSIPLDYNLPHVPNASSLGKTSSQIEYEVPICHINRRFSKVIK